MNHDPLIPPLGLAIEVLLPSSPAKYDPADPNNFPVIPPKIEQDSAIRNLIENYAAKKESKLMETPIAPSETVAPPISTPDPELAEQKKHYNPNWRHEPRTYWKFEECEKVAEVAARKIRKQGLILPSKDRDGNRHVSRSLTNYLIPIFQEAQAEALPRDRRKVMKHWNHLTKPTHLLLAVERFLLNVHTGAPPAFKNGDHEPAPAPVAAPAPVYQPTSFAAQSDEDLMREFTRRFFEPKVAQEKKLAELEEFNELVSAEISGLVKKIEDLQKRISAQEVHASNAENVVKEKLPVVVLIGLHKHVFEEVKSLYAQTELPPMNFRLMETGTQPEAFKADYAICQKFVSHAWYDQMQKATKNCLFVDGGAEKIVKKLRALIEE